MYDSFDPGSTTSASTAILAWVSAVAGDSALCLSPHVAPACAGVNVLGRWP